MRPLAEAISFSMVPIRVAGAVLGAGSLIALLLATIGVHGVVAFHVAQRLHEIGIRMALGARRIDVVGLVVRRGLRSTLWGIVLGALGSIATTRLIAGLLYGVSPSDPLTIAAIALLLVAVSVAASLVPSRRATSVDPSRALRVE